MAILHAPRPVLSDALGRPAANDDIAHWLVTTSATLFRLADHRARASVHATRKRRSRAAAPIAMPLLTHPDPEVRLLAELAGKLGEAAEQLAPSPQQLDEIPF
jgi:hypothetical protein